MWSGDELLETLTGLDITDVVMIPDSTIGAFEPALRASTALRLIKVSREGEAWGVAAGLLLGGRQPLVVIQCTGLFESGDALRNVAHDWRLPVHGLVGYRSYLNAAAIPGDTCLRFTEPVLAAWDLDTEFVDEPGKKDRFPAHVRSCRERGVPGITLFAEGRA